MNNILQISKIVYICLILFQIALIIIKKIKYDSLIFICYLLFYCSRIFYFNNITIWLIFISIHNLFLINILYYSKQKEFPVLWNLTISSLALILFIIYLLGFSYKFNFIISTSLLAAGSSIFPLRLLFLFYNRTDNKIFIYFFICLMIFTFTGIFDTVNIFFNSVDMKINFWVSFLMLSGCFYLLKQDSLKFKYILNTERKEEIILRLEEAEERLIMNERLMISSYRVAGILHEFKNIISNIGLSAEYGLSGKDVNNKNNSLNMILNNTQTGMDSVIRNLESIGLMDTADIQLVEIDEMINKIIKNVRTNYSEINFIIENSEKISIKMYRMDLEQVIISLLRNAIAAIKNNKEIGGQIKINTYKLDNLITIDIEDNAGGVPEGLQDMLFEHPSSCKVKKGLGLYLSRKIVTSNNGNLDFYPVENGSCFRIIFIDKEN